jgi:hypothetical protein
MLMQNSLPSQRFADDSPHSASSGLSPSASYELESSEGLTSLSSSQFSSLLTGLIHDLQELNQLSSYLVPRSSLPALPYPPSCPPPVPSAPAVGSDDSAPPNPQPSSSPQSDSSSRSSSSGEASQPSSQTPPPTEFLGLPSSSPYTTSYPTPDDVQICLPSSDQSSLATVQADSSDLEDPSRSRLIEANGKSSLYRHSSGQYLVFDRYRDGVLGLELQHPKLSGLRAISAEATSYGCQVVFKSSRVSRFRLATFDREGFVQSVRRIGKSEVGTLERQFAHDLNRDGLIGQDPRSFMNPFASQGVT